MNTNRSFFYMQITFFVFCILTIINSCDYFSPENLDEIIRENPIDPEAENFIGTISIVSGSTPTWSIRPTWKWYNVDGMINTRVRIDSGEWVVIGNAVTDTYTPSTALSIGEHTLEVQTTPDNISWSESGTFSIEVSSADNSSDWTYSFGYNYRIYAMDSDLSGNVYLTGRDDTEDTSWAAKFDYSGNLVWEATGYEGLFSEPFDSVYSDGFSGFFTSLDNNVYAFNKINSPYLAQHEDQRTYKGIGTDFIIIGADNGFMCLDLGNLETILWEYNTSYTIIGGNSFIHVGNDGNIYCINMPADDPSILIIEKINSSTHIKEWDYSIQGHTVLAGQALVALSNGCGAFSCGDYISETSYNYITYTFDYSGNFTQSSSFVNFLIQDKDRIFGTDGSQRNVGIQGTHLIEYDQDLNIIDEYTEINMSNYSTPWSQLKILNNVLYVGENNQLKKIIIE